MAGRTPYEAFRNYGARLNDALHCLTPRGFSTRVAAANKVAVGVDYPIALNDLGTPIPLRAVRSLQFNAAQIVQISEVDAPGRARRFQVGVRKYSYELLTASRNGLLVEILAFQWTPDATEPGTVTFPHLHIGPALGGGNSMIRPGDVRKIHVPTGYVSLTAIVRLAIAEFGATPLRANWEMVLRRIDESFEHDTALT